MTMTHAMKVKMEARNVMSDRAFHFDLQRFGHHGGKSGGKIFFSILLGVAGFYFGGWAFGLTKWGGALLGASLGGSIWTATHKPDMGNLGSPNVQRFDRAQEQMSSNGQIPVVYGLRKIAGNQTYHWTDSEANELHKHVVLCEGGIEGVVSVTANDLLIPTGNQSEGAVFTLQNLLDKNAEAYIDNKHLHLIANGQDHDVYLCNKDDGKNNESYFEWQVSISALVSYINRMHEGWQAFPTAVTSKYPGDLRLNRQNCYMSPAKVMIDTVKNNSGGGGGSSKAIGFGGGKNIYCPGGNPEQVKEAMHGIIKGHGHHGKPSGDSGSSTAGSKDIRGGTNYVFHDGDLPDNYEEVGAYPHLAWLDMYFSISQELNGNPTVAVIVKGRKVYDIRNGRTAYSTNPALCLLDFMTNKTFGLGKWFSMSDIDKDSWCEAANYCDQTVTFHNSDGVIVRGKRYELNMVIDQKASGMNWVQEILANFGGYLTISNGKIKLKIEKRTPVSYRFNDDNCSDLSVAPIHLSETPNRYTVKIVDPLNNWQSVACLCEDFADQKERGKIVNKEIQLNGVTSQNQALRLARFYRDYNLACPMNVSFKAGQQAIHLEPGDVVTVSYHDVLHDLPIRIKEMKENEDGTIQISGRQYNDTLYSDELGGGVHWYNYGAPVDFLDEDSPMFSMRNVKGLRATSRFRHNSDGTTAYDIIVTFTLPDLYAINRAKVYFKRNNIPAADLGIIFEGVPADKLGFTMNGWVYAGEATHQLVIPNVKIGDIYHIRAVSCSRKGREADINNSPECVCRVTAKKLVPPQPHNLTYNFAKTFHFDWNDVDDADVLYYEVRSDMDKGVQHGLLAKVVAPAADVKLTERKGTVYVYAVNSQGRYSYPARVNYEYPKLPAPTQITFDPTPRGCTIQLSAFPSTAQGAKIFIEGNGTSDVITTENYMYTYQKAGIYTVHACFYDLIGDGDMSQDYEMTVEPTFKDEWIKDGSLGIDKADAVIKDAVQKAQDSKTRLDGVDKTIVELKQSDKDITETVAANKKAADGSIETLTTQTKQNAESITSVVDNLNKDPAESGYSSITQLKDDVNLRVQKGDVINQINLTSEGTTIQGKYLHVTGETKIDDNVIVGGMIKAGAITADKMSAELIHLGKGQGFAGNGATVSSEGMRIDGADGSSVTFSRDGLVAKDKNGNTFSAVNHIMIGSARNGQYVRFRTPWPTVPAVVVSPMNVVVADSTFTSQKVSFHCYASEISRNGFRMNMYSSIGSASGSMAYHQDLGHWQWTIGRCDDANGDPRNQKKTPFDSRLLIAAPLGARYPHCSQSWSSPSILASKVKLHGHISIQRDYKGNALGFWDVDHQRLTIRCGGRQTYTGLFFGSTELLTDCTKGRHTIDFVTPELTVTPNQNMNCTLDLSPVTDHPGDGEDGLQVWITIDSIEYVLNSDQKLDTNGTGMFIAVSKNSQLYTVQ